MFGCGVALCPRSNIFSPGTGTATYVVCQYLQQLTQLFVFIAFTNVYTFSEETSMAYRYTRLARLALKIAIAMVFHRRFALSALVCARLCKNYLRIMSKRYFKCYDTIILLTD